VLDHLPALVRSAQALLHHREPDAIGDGADQPALLLQEWPLVRLRALARVVDGDLADVVAL
jgi:hypothetical protein